MEITPRNINTSTGISIGIVVIVLGGFAWVIKGQNDTKDATRDMKNELMIQAMATKNEMMGRMDKMESRMAAYEATKNSWTSTDMFRWAVHLQQANPQIKVPEPEVNTK
jgi:hypothetical protein